MLCVVQRVWDSCVGRNDRKGRDSSMERKVKLVDSLFSEGHSFRFGGGGQKAASQSWFW